VTPAAAFDFQKPDLGAWFCFVGVETVRSIVAERMPGEQGGLSREQAVSAAAALARSLA